MLSKEGTILFLLDKVEEIFDEKAFRTLYNLIKLDL